MAIEDGGGRVAAAGEGGWLSVGSGLAEGAGGGVLLGVDRLCGPPGTVPSLLPGPL